MFIYKIIIYTIIKDVLDHSSVLKAVDGLDLLLNTMCINDILTLFYFQLIICDTKVKTSNNIDMGNRLVVCVYLMVNVLLDSSTHTYHQKDS